MTIKFVSKRLILAAAVTVMSAHPSQAQMPPLNPAPAMTGPNACAVSSSQFQSWQSPGGGFVSANSAAFVPSSQCAFFQWGAQMFLYLTSANKNSGQMNFLSGPFYNADATTDTFTPYASTNSEIKTSKSKKLFNVRVNKELKSLRMKAASPALNPDQEEGQAFRGAVLTLSGSAIAVPGQSGWFTLPVTYYTISVNDAYVALANNQSSVTYFIGTDSKDPDKNTYNFPVNLQEMTDIAAKGPVSNPSQLALEIKTAWVDTAYLPKSIPASNLITIQADVPAFQSSTTNGSTVWTAGTVTTQRTLALVGMHVVGSVTNHPELVWATFESTYNTPDATFYYVDQNGNTDTQPWTANLANGNYVFYDKGQSFVIPANPVSPQILVKVNPSNSAQLISATSANLPGPTANPVLPVSLVSRLSPWGLTQPAAASGATPGLLLTNTNLASLQASLAPQLKGTTQANYFQTGSLWLLQNNATGPYTIPNTKGQTLIASQQLANTTMETFNQFAPSAITGNPPAKSLQCFDCHNVPQPVSAQNPGAGVSHVFP